MGGCHVVLRILLDSDHFFVSFSSHLAGPVSIKLKRTVENDFWDSRNLTITEGKLGTSFFLLFLLTYFNVSVSVCFWFCCLLFLFMLLLRAVIHLFQFLKNENSFLKDFYNFTSNNKRWAKILFIWPEETYFSWLDIVISELTAR